MQESGIAPRSGEEVSGMFGAGGSALARVGKEGSRVVIIIL